MTRSGVRKGSRTAGPTALSIFPASCRLLRPFGLRTTMSNPLCRRRTASCSLISTPYSTAPLGPLHSHASWIEGDAAADGATDVIIAAAYHESARNESALEVVAVNVVFPVSCV